MLLWKMLWKDLFCISLLVSGSLRYPLAYRHITPSLTPLSNGYLYYLPLCMSVPVSKFPLYVTPVLLGFPGGSDSKSACNAEDPGLIPVLGRSPGEAHGYPLQYSCLENSMEEGIEHTLMTSFFLVISIKTYFQIRSQSEIWGLGLQLIF